MRWVFALAGNDDLPAWEALGIDVLHPVAIPTPTYRAAYDVIANELLWFCFHGLWDLAFEPVADSRLEQAWEHYVAFNDRMVEATLATAVEHDVLVLNDYHLLLAPQLARQRGWRGPITLFLHTPLPRVDEFRVLPPRLRRALLEGMASADLVGVHANRWALRLAALFDDAGLPVPRIVVAPLPADVLGVQTRSRDGDVARAGEILDALIADRPTIARIDRIEPSKNLLRGVAAVDRLLERHPSLRGQLRVLAFAYPSRAGIEKYDRLRSRLEQALQAVNDRWRRGAWEPIVARLDDDAARSLAAYQRFRALLINPLRDGLNLVAAESSLLAPTGAQLVLSSEAGIAEHIGAHVLIVDPFDVEATAEALAAAIDEGGDLSPVRSWVKANTWERWLTSINPRSQARP